MKQGWILLTALGGAGIIFAADQPKKEAETAAQIEIAQLKTRVTQLESRLTALEARVPDKAQLQFLLDRPAPLPNHDPIAPPHIAEREVNGLKFYVVPLGDAK